MNSTSLPAEPRKHSAFEMDHAGIHGGFQRCPSWKYKYYMNIYRYWVNGNLDSGVSLQSAWGVWFQWGGTRRWMWANEWLILSPHPDLLLDDPEGKFHFCWTCDPFTKPDSSSPSECRLLGGLPPKGGPTGLTRSLEVPSLVKPSRGSRSAESLCTNWVACLRRLFCCRIALFLSSISHSCRSGSGVPSLCFSSGSSCPSGRGQLFLVLIVKIQTEQVLLGICWAVPWTRLLVFALWKLTQSQISFPFPFPFPTALLLLLSLPFLLLS